MTRRIFVGNLARGTDGERIRTWLVSQGIPVRSVQIVVDRATGCSRGFAFADLDYEEGTDDALAAPHPLDGSMPVIRMVTDAPNEVPYVR